VIHISRFQIVVMAAVGATAAAMVVALAMVPGVGSIPNAGENVAAAVLAIVPSALRYTALPGPEAGGFIKYPAGIVATGADAVSAERMACVVYVFFVTAAGRVYSNSVCVPV
jgi:hypothetical protein